MDAEAPVLARLATPLGPAPGRPQLPTWPIVEAVLDPAEKSVISSPITGSDDQPATLHTAAAACNVSRQLQDWSVPGFDLDAALDAAVLAKLEAALLDDLAAAGVAAADLTAALTACRPMASHVLGGIGPLAGLATELAALGQAGLRPEVIPTPNTEAVLVIAAPAVTIAASSVKIGSQPRPGEIGLEVGAWVYGMAGASVAGAVQVVTVA